MFKDWRTMDQSPVDMLLDDRFIYYIHGRAWGLKGWIGGTHSYLTFFSRKYAKWLVAEITDSETLMIQRSSIIWCKLQNIDHQYRTVYISDRINSARWFGAAPKIVDKSELGSIDIDAIISASEQYHNKEFNLITNNCNTYVSYLNWYLNLKFKRPFRSVGYKKTWNHKL